MKGVVMTRLQDKAQLGFWIYLMTDAVIFASLFATYVILRHGTNGGPSTHEIFDMPYVLVESVVLLASTVAVGIANIALQYGKKTLFKIMLLATLLLGEIFIGMELNEFANLIKEGHNWQQSAFLSGYFTLVGVHGIHVFVGLIWGAVLALALLSGAKIKRLKEKFAMFTIFWHFLDLVWIFIFTVVYALGVL